MGYVDARRYDRRAFLLQEIEIVYENRGFPETNCDRSLRSQLLDSVLILGRVPVLRSMLSLGTAHSETHIRVPKYLCGE